MVKELSRRTFVTSAAVVGGLAVVGAKFFGTPAVIMADSESGAVKEDRWIPTACWMCREGCALKAHRVDGVIVKIEGEEKCPMNQGKICGRSHAGMFKIYNPYRCKTPVKRTNPNKGRDVDPGWQEISYDEALNLVAEKMKVVKANNPNEFMHTYGWGGGYSGGWTAIHTAFGSINRQSGYGGITCGAAMHTAAYQMVGTSSDSSDDIHSRCMIRSSSQGVNKAGVADTRKFTDRRIAGMKFVVVDPRLSIEASKADEWVPIRPASDRLLQLAMMHVLLYELNIFDEEFIKRQSNGVYLIRKDGGPEDGQYLRNEDELVADPYRKGLLFGKPYVWDTSANDGEGGALVWDDPQVNANWETLALEGEFTVDGVKCVPAFQLFKENLRQYTPEMAAPVTTVSTDTIRRLTKLLVDEANIGGTISIPGPDGESTVMPYRPIGTRWRGPRMNKMWDPMTSYLLYELLGAIGVPGGIIGEGGDVSPSPADGVNAPKGSSTYRFKWPPDAYMMDTWYPMAYKTVPLAYKNMLEPNKYGCEYTTKIMMIHGCNALMAGGAVDEMIEAFKTIDFIFALSYHFDEATEMADVIFPDPGYTGWLRESRGGAWIHQPLLDKDLYQTYQVEQVIIDIADRVGFLPALNTQISSTMRLRGANALDVNVKYTWEDILDRSLKAKYGNEHGLEWFKVNGILEEEEDIRELYEFNSCPWGKTRYTLYNDYMLWAGRQHKKDLAAVGQPDLEQKFHPNAYKDFVPLPFWEEPPSLASAPAEFDLYGINWKGPMMSMGQTMDNAMLREYMDKFDEYTMAAWMNEDTAAAKGLKNGDLVWIESAARVKSPKAVTTKIQAELKTSQGIHPTTVAIGGEFGQWSPHYSPVGRGIGPHYNALISWDEECVDPLSSGFTVLCKIKVTKV